MAVVGVNWQGGLKEALVSKRSPDGPSKEPDHTKREMTHMDTNLEVV
jgi:hypothetical protein